MRPSSLGGGRILRRTLSVRVSVCLSVCPSVRPVIITERHVAPPSELQWHTCTFWHALTASVLFGTHWGPHIVRPSRPHKFLFYAVFIVLRAAVRAPVSLAVLLGFTCLVAFVCFVYFYEQINDWLIDWLFGVLFVESKECKTCCSPNYCGIHPRYMISALLLPPPPNKS